MDFRKTFVMYCKKNAGGKIVFFIYNNVVDTSLLIFKRISDFRSWLLDLLGGTGGWFRVVASVEN